MSATIHSEDTIARSIELASEESHQVIYEQSFTICGIEHPYNLVDDVEMLETLMDANFSAMSLVEMEDLVAQCQDHELVSAFLMGKMTRYYHQSLNGGVPEFLADAQKTSFEAYHDVGRIQNPGNRLVNTEYADLLDSLPPDLCTADEFEFLIHSAPDAVSRAWMMGMYESTAELLGFYNLPQTVEFYAKIVPTGMREIRVQ